MNIAFVCIQNSCRSQIAEAFGKQYFPDSINCYSAGTDPANQINPKAIKIMKEKYHIDMTQNQFPKKISQLPSIDILVTMGCGIQCPYVSCKKLIEWNIEDPVNKDDKVFIDIIEQIKTNITNLKSSVIVE